MRSILCRKHCVGRVRLKLPSRQYSRSTHPQSQLFTPPAREWFVLGIETSCDDTAVVSSTGRILADVVDTQDKLHGPRKGIIPYEAGLAHKEAIDRAIQSTIKNSKISRFALSAIAVTRGPGMAPCLDVGLNAAKQLSRELAIPLMPVNHMEGHALVARLPLPSYSLSSPPATFTYAPPLDNSSSQTGPITSSSSSLPSFPFLCLLVSGGHSLLVLCVAPGAYIQIGTTLDDAIGEAYDKVARQLDLAWEGGGGRALEEAARKGKANPDIQFPRPLIKIKNCNFSFSGLKTAVEKFIDRQESDFLHNSQNVNDIAFAFQYRAVQHVVERLERAIAWMRSPAALEVLSTEFGVDVLPQHLVVSGGVACNEYLRTRLSDTCSEYHLELCAPPARLCRDNGVMIAWAGIERLIAGIPPLSPRESQSLTYEPRWRLDPKQRSFFPNTHRRDPLVKHAAYSPGLISACERRLNEGIFDEALVLSACRSALNGFKFEQARNLCQVALQLSPDNKKLVTTMHKIRSAQQTHNYATKGVIDV